MLLYQLFKSNFTPLRRYSTPQMPSLPKYSTNEKILIVSLVIGWMDDNYKWNCFFYYISLLIVKYINSIGKFKFEYFVTWVEEAWKLYNFSLENWAKTAREEYLWFRSMLRLKRNLTHRHSGEIGSELFSF